MVARTYYSTGSTAQSLLFALVTLLSVACQADEQSPNKLSPNEQAELAISCQKQQRHFTLSPVLPMAYCVVIDSYHTHAHSYQAMQARHEESKALVSDRMALLESVLIELDYLSSGFQQGTLGYPAAINQQSRGVLTKNMVARDLVLLHQLLKEVEVSAALGANHHNRIVQTLVLLAEGLGSFLYSFDMMTTPCPSGSSHCPALLFMAPVLWTDIVHRLDHIQSLNSENFGKLEPYLNNMLEAHAQASFGIPLYLPIYDPRTTSAHSGRYFLMDYANQGYRQALTAWGMATDWHRSEYSAASLKMWGYMRNDANFQFSLTSRISFSEDAHYYAEQALQRLNALIAAHDRQPRSSQLVTLPSYRAEMFNSTGHRVQTEQVVGMINLFEERESGSREAYSARYQATFSGLALFFSFSHREPDCGLASQSHTPQQWPFVVFLSHDCEIQ